METQITTPAESDADATAPQRERLMEALAECAAEKGLAQVTVYDIASRAGSSKRTFYRCFADKDECRRAAAESFVDEAQEAIDGATEETEDPVTSVRAGIGALVAAIAARPSFARLAFLEESSAGPFPTPSAVRSSTPAAPAGERVLERLFEVADGISGKTGEVNPLARRAALGGAEGLIADALIAGRAARLGERAPELVYITLLPYLGQAGALAQSRLAKA
jgi:AcrR family transcriptional regulator